MPHLRNGQRYSFSREPISFLLEYMIIEALPSGLIPDSFNLEIYAAGNSQEDVREYLQPSQCSGSKVYRVKVLYGGSTNIVPMVVNWDDPMRFNRIEASDVMVNGQSISLTVASPANWIAAYPQRFWDIPGESRRFRTVEGNRSVNISDYSTSSFAQDYLREYDTQTGRWRITPRPDSPNPVPQPEPEPEPQTEPAPMPQPAPAPISGMRERPSGTICTWCSRPYSDSNPAYQCGSSHVCRVCFDDNFSRIRSCNSCEVCDDRTVCINSEYYCQQCADDNFSRCCDCCNHRIADDIIRYQDRDICRNCFRPEWEPSDWEAPNENTYNLVPERLTFGVELETSSSPDYANLYENTNWGCVREASTSGKEFISPVLFGDAGLQEIEDFISSNASGWRINDSCGTHVHFSVENWTLDEKAKVVYGMRCLESEFRELQPNRMDNSMCGAATWQAHSLFDFEDVEDLAADTDKFQWFNIRPLLRINTVENRLLRGTLDANLIIGWIRLNAALIYSMLSQDWEKLKSDMAFPEVAFKLYAGVALTELSEILGVEEPSQDQDEVVAGCDCDNCRRACL